MINLLAAIVLIAIVGVILRVLGEGAWESFKTKKVGPFAGAAAIVVWGVGVWIAIFNVATGSSVLWIPLWGIGFPALAFWIYVQVTGKDGQQQ